MDAYHRLSVLSHRGSKPLGKVKQRVQDLRIPSSSNWDYEASGSRLDLSHNESARFAADSLLSQGLEGYRQVLKAEGEVDFLSELEKDYILQNGSYSITDDSGSEGLFADCQSCSCCPAVSTHIDSTVECLEHKTSEDVKSAPLLDDLSTEVFFQTDSSAAGMKDLVRQFLRKAKRALVVVMDKFSDPELLCDLLEASRKRKVSVHLLLDDLNLKLFVDMWQDLKLIGKNFPKVSVGSIPGQTYCAKTGKKLTGQSAESFIIADRQEVLTGTYSFTWLSGQVDRSMLVLIKGSSVSHFHQEFLRLNSSSKPVPGFNTFVPLPEPVCLFSKSHKLQTVHPWTHGGIDLWSTQGDKKSNTDGRADQVLSDLHSQLQSTAANTTAERNVEVHEDHSLIAMSTTQTHLRKIHNQSSLNKKNCLSYPDGGTDGVFSHQRNTSRLPEAADFTPDSQQIAPNTSHQTPSKPYLSKLQTNTFFGETSKQDEFIKQHQGPLSSLSYALSPCLKPAPAEMKTSLSPQHQAEPRMFLSDVRSRTNLHPVLSQQVNLSQRKHWSPQQAAGPRAMARYYSFSGTHVMTGQAGWRALQNDRNTSLGRSLSMMERFTAGYRGAGLHPNWI